MQFPVCIKGICNQILADSSLSVEHLPVPVVTMPGRLSYFPVWIGTSHFAS